MHNHESCHVLHDDVLWLDNAYSVATPMFHDDLDCIVTQLGMSQY